MIIVFGSNVLDIFFHQPDLPPRDTALFLDTHQEAPGGKGANQAVAAAKAGSQVRFFGALGDGGHGRQMYKNLAKCGVDVSGIQTLDMPSGLATIFVDETDGTHRIVVSQGANLHAKESTVPNKYLNADSILLLQGELPITETEKLIIRAKNNGAKTVLNFAPATAKLSETLLNNLDYIILNEHEAALLAQQLGMTAEDKLAFSRALKEQYDLTCIITLGPEGSIVCTQEGALKIPSLKIKPIDTVGAGDAHAGYFCAALDQGEDFETALKWASVAGSLACTSVGAQSALPDKADVMNHIVSIQITQIYDDALKAASN
ncbi:MAG: ribokinase [Alphaproteobacteria bacterium]|nr:ribokinase [Alphaproteobacteria bacterium]NCQ88666.1 ribokinase [Alphaproteobacteria bacterium]NCT06209.1 ribokinase [Alphaproteobacteria bacterium]